MSCPAEWLESTGDGFCRIGNGFPPGAYRGLTDSPDHLTGSDDRQPSERDLLEVPISGHQGVRVGSQGQGNQVIVLRVVRNHPWRVDRIIEHLGPVAIRRGHDVLARVDLVRVNDHILGAAGSMLPAELRSLGAIHLATAQALGSDLARIVTYDERMATAAKDLGWRVARPS
jgi:hypothetical protein